MIEPPVCKNPNCEYFNKWSGNKIIVKIKDSKDKYVCKNVIKSSFGQYLSQKME